ncbi:FAD-dependent pyridine nucleotide-disulfide oxidoreductase [Rhodococcus triatomae BKS 15-14]|nr:FAD-dependent pyridine nucleotide-disulfide oxidoreductase [Rhodococcus triatomae BKS 15-14]
MKQVVVVGAGYAGVMAANRIAARNARDAVVTIVNPRREFVERIRLHQTAAGTGTAARPLAALLHPTIRLCVATVRTIAERSVTLDSGGEVPFDHLVYAVGSGAVHPGAGHVDVGGVSGLDAATSLNGRLRALPHGARVVVVGGGLTGIETAAEIAGRFPTLATHVVTRAFGASLSVRGRAAVEQALTGLGVSIHAGRTVSRVGADGAEFDGGGRLFGDCTIWAGAFAVPELARSSGLPVDRYGRLRTDESLVCVGHPRIVGVGDAVSPPPAVAGHLRMSCQAAIPMGAHGADAIAALLNDRIPPTLSVGFIGQAVSLGRRGGVIQTTRSDDSPRSLVVRGGTAAVVKEAVCRSTMTALKNPGLYRWMPGPRMANPSTARELPC